jgi:hypothetical protein
MRIHDSIHDLFRAQCDDRAFYEMIKYSLFFEKDIQKVMILERHYWFKISYRIVILFFQLNFQIFHENDEDFYISLTR